MEIQAAFFYSNWMHEKGIICVITLALCIIVRAFKYFADISHQQLVSLVIRFCVRVISEMIKLWLLIAKTLFQILVDSSETGGGCCVIGTGLSSNFFHLYL